MNNKFELFLERILTRKITIENNGIRILDYFHKKEGVEIMYQLKEENLWMAAVTTTIFTSELIEQQILETFLKFNI